MKHKISLPAKFALLLSLAALFSFIRKADDPIDKIVAALQKWIDANPQEKIYLHTDRPYYSIGDTIWFKGYLLTGSHHQLSAISGAVYVDLITEGDSLVKSLKLPVTSGMVMGDFILEDELHEGNYRLRAYTQWMRNAGDSYFFDRTFTVGSAFSSNILTKASYNYKNGSADLNATLNYTDIQGKPIANHDVRYQIIVNKNVVYSKNAQTDAQGNISVGISNDNKADLRGAYIRTTIENADKKVIIRDFPIKAGVSETDVQFFPESGNLINGITSRVAFKAVGIDGLGATITGKVLDNNNTEVADIVTTHAGMGSFNLRPEAGKTYTAKLNFADGSVKSVGLPKAAEDGFVLSIYQPNADSILVRVSAAEKQVQTQTSVSLLAQTGGETIFASSLKIARPVTSIWLEKKAFPSGIAQFTLFNSAGEPLNERVAFIRTADQMQLTVKTARNSYKSKDKVELLVDAKDSKGKPTIGNFSVTVIDESKAPVDENNESTILSNVLLTSDLKGYVEKPNYYFAANTDDVNRDLDNLMMTQGYRRFTWKQVTDPTLAATKPAFEKEGLGYKISGKVITLTGNKPIPYADLGLISTTTSFVKQTTADAQGRFTFPEFFLGDSIRFVVQGRTPTKSNKVIVIMDTIPKMRVSKNKNIADVNTDIPGTMKTYIETARKQDEIYEKAGLFDKVQRLREVQVSTKRKGPDPKIAPQGMFTIPPGTADQTLTFPEAESCATLLLCLQRKMPAGTRLEQTTDGRYHIVDLRGTILVFYLNGRRIDNDDEVNDLLIGAVEPENIARIEVVRTNMALITMLGNEGKGAFMIITKSPVTRTVYEPSTVNLKPKGFNRVREFYSPKYDKPGVNLKIPDLRTTVYWNPYIKTNANGKALTSFFNADGPGNYKVIIEGVNADGELGRAVYKFNVEAGMATGALWSPKPLNRNATMIASAIDSFNKKRPVENLYLHTDKPYYNIGDTLWFKSYLTDAKLNPSKLSGFIYVELNDDSAEVMRRIKVPVKAGIAWGQIPLNGKILHEGGYTLRAYTNWMQNQGPDAFFTQRLYLGVPTRTQWLVNSNATLTAVENKDRLDMDIRLSQGNRKPLALRNVEVKILEMSVNDKKFYIFNEKMRTGIDGSIKISKLLSEKVNGQILRVQIRSLEKEDDDKIVQVPINVSRPKKIDVQFLPEGGNMVAGLKSTIGFKAIGEDGKGITVAGAVYDSRGTKIIDFTSLYKGMGSFDFTPRLNETYTAKITQPVLEVKTYELPQAFAKGNVLHVENAENADSLSVTLLGMDKITADSNYCLIAGSNNINYFTQPVDHTNTHLNIPKSLFPSGIARITLLKGKKPLNERAVFIDKKDRLNIRIAANKTIFKKRDSVELEIDVTDARGLPVEGNFSLAVTDNYQVTPDMLGNNHIGTGLLLNSVLKGTIETPGYYLSRTDKQAWQALDNLLLTQGWVGYDWQDVFVPTLPKYGAEQQFTISGRVINGFAKPVAGAQVMLSSQKPTLFKTIYTDNNGEYKFSNLPIIDSGSFFLQANNAKGNKLFPGDVLVYRTHYPDVPETLTDVITPWYVNTDSTQLNYVARASQRTEQPDPIAQGTLLNNVTINKLRIKNGQYTVGFDEKDIKESATMDFYEFLKQKIPGFKIIRDYRFAQGKVVAKVDKFAADGVLTQLEDPYDLETAKERVREFKMANIKGKIEVVYDYREQKVYVKAARLNRPPVPATATYRPYPLAYPQQFYSPKYTVATANAKPDYRSTLFWEPNIYTDANGKAKIHFYTSDQAVNYTVNIQGTNGDGLIGSFVSRFPDNLKPVKPGLE